MEPLTPAFMDFGREPPLPPLPTTTRSHTTVLTRREKNEIRTKNRIEQSAFKAANKAVEEAELREAHRILSGASRDAAVLFEANAVLRIELARANDALQTKRNHIRRLKAQFIAAGIQPANGELNKGAKEQH